MHTLQCRHKVSPAWKIPEPDLSSIEKWHRSIKTLGNEAAKLLKLHPNKLRRIDAQDKTENLFAAGEYVLSVLFVSR